MKTIETKIPFQGFYQGTHADIDEYVYGYGYTFCEHGNDGEEWEECEECDAIFNGIDFKKFHQNYAKLYCEHFQTEINDLLNIELKITYKELVSPREYNFTTDEIFVDIDDKTLDKIISIVMENVEEFQSILKERFTSSDGFISFYSNQLSDWMPKITAKTLDHNEIFAMMLTLVKIADYEEENLENDNCELEV